MCTNMDTLPTVTVVIEGQNYILEPEDYVLEITQQGETACMNGWMSMNLPEHMEGFVILGDLFIKRYYTHFDYGQNRVGFARAAPS